MRAQSVERQPPSGDPAADRGEDYGSATYLERCRTRDQRAVARLNRKFEQSWEMCRRGQHSRPLSDGACSICATPL